MSKIPPTREITKEDATVFEERNGLYVPVDDGMDVPGWEYYVMHTICGKTFRTPIRQEQRDWPNDYEYKGPEHEGF